MLVLLILISQINLTTYRQRATEHSATKLLQTFTASVNLFIVSTLSKEV